MGLHHGILTSNFTCDGPKYVMAEGYYFFSRRVTCYLINCACLRKDRHLRLTGANELLAA